MLNPLVHEVGGTKIVEYWFPLRTGLMVRIALPVDVTFSEIERMRKFLEALVC